MRVNTAVINTALIQMSFCSTFKVKVLIQGLKSREGWDVWGERGRFRGFILNTLTHFRMMMSSSSKIPQGDLFLLLLQAIKIRWKQEIWILSQA